MAYELRYTREAAKALAAIPKADAKRILRKLEDLAKNPQAAPGVKKLVDREGYRIRSGDWRAIYTLDHGELVVTVIKVDNRKDAYRR